jgi:murein DD-endopeptidase MepM/ murein hydrolase activator NlpD
MKKKNVLTLVFAGVFLFIVILVVFLNKRSIKIEEQVLTSGDTLEIPVAEPRLFGLNVDTFHVLTASIKNGDSFGKIMDNVGLGPAAVHTIATAIDSVFDLRLLHVGNNYRILLGDSSQVPHFFIYEENLLNYYLISLKDSIYAVRGERKKEVKQRYVTGVINSSLYETFSAKEVSPALAVKLSDVYAWTIDFFRIQKGDSVTLMYEDIYVDDTIYAGTGEILAARFDHFGEPYYAFRFQDPSGMIDYYDEAGNSLRKAFLRAPLQYSRISSRYSKRRFHPVQKRWKAHLGTDYAAPRGTPIMTTADGVIERTGYTSGNGNYVKVRHNSKYSTQYLHMSKIKKGMRTGVRVRQGDVIGYVGSTGLATGPHVCYRFWVNGKQVDPYKQELPDANPIKEEYRQEYLQFAETQLKLLTKPEMDL